MPSLSTDRINGLSTSVAVKAPVKAVAIANITLSGEQTVNGVAVVDGDRVLVTAQSSSIDNGIYDVSTSAWTRSPDFDGNRDVVKGTLVVSNSSASVYYKVTTADPITIGSSAIVFEAVAGSISQSSIGSVLWPISQDETDSGLVANDLSEHWYYGNILRYGADPTGTTDSSAAIQAALDVGNEVYIPAGTYDVGTALVVEDYGRLIYGDGPELSVINLTGTNHGFTSTQSLLRVVMRDFSIQGDASTGCGIYFDQDGSTEFTYCSSFENLYIYTGDQAIYMPGNFSCVFKNIYASSHTQNVFEVQGGTVTMFDSCYAQSVPAGKYGYRIYGRATLINCNGIDTPSNAGARWGLFGRAISKGDPVDSQYYITMFGCNIENFNDYGLHFRFDGVANLFNPQFVAKATGTYEASILVEFCDRLIYISNPSYQTNGATRVKLAEIYAENSAYILGDGALGHVDVAGVLNNNGGVNYAVVEANESGQSMRNLQVTRRAFLDEALLTGVAGPAASGVVSLGNGTQATVGAAGGASPIPTPVGYLKIYIGSTQYVIPYCAQA